MVNLFWRWEGNQHQKHFLCTIEGPVSLNSALVIHMFWNVDSEDNIDPPIHTKNFLSWEATTLTLMVAGARPTNSLFSLSAIPVNMVVPPLMTMLENNSFRTSTSHLVMDWYVSSWMPGMSFPMFNGLKRASGHLNFWLPTSMVSPSGSS